MLAAAAGLLNTELLARAGSTHTTKMVRGFVTHHWQRVISIELKIIILVLSFYKDKKTILIFKDFRTRIYVYI